MLNITRKVGERIVIGEDIVLEVMEVSGTSVRLGINAPRSVPVYREEIWDSVRAENAAAAKTAPTKLPEPPTSPDGGTRSRSSVRSSARAPGGASMTGTKDHSRRDASAGGSRNTAAEA